jgi:hypothetical protein
VDVGGGDPIPMALLEDVSRRVDLLWEVALLNGDDHAVDIGEASQAIHRALILLSEYGNTPDCEAPRVSVG